MRCAPRPNRMIRTALLATAALALTACLGSDFTDSIEDSWQLDSGTYQGEPVPIVGSHPITMTLEAGRIGGTAACNSYGGAYRVSGREFSIVEGLAVTEMACSPMEVMESERTFLDALAAVDEIELTNAGLVLRGTEVELTFSLLEPVPTAELTGTVWVLDALIRGDAVSSPHAGAETATLELFDDGTFTGHTGCRAISGSYQVTGAEVHFTDWEASGECSSDLRDQDSQVISALEGGFRVEIEEDRMTTWVAGDEGLVYRARS